MRLVRAVVAALLIAAPVGLTAQQKPAFSGTWIIQPPNKAAGMEQVVTQDARTMTVVIAGRTLEHQLDGVERRKTMAMRGGEIVILSTAAWEGNTIVVTTATAYPNRMRTVEREIWSIDAQGQLVIDYTETADGQTPRVIKVVHKKKV